MSAITESRSPSTRAAGPGFHTTGAIYDLVRTEVNAMKAGEANGTTSRFDPRGALIEVELNGKRVSRIQLDDWTQPNKRPDGSDHKFDVIFKDHPRKGIHRLARSWKRLLVSKHQAQAHRPSLGNQLLTLREASATRSLDRVSPPGAETGTQRVLKPIRLATAHTSGVPGTLLLHRGSTTSRRSILRVEFRFFMLLHRGSTTRRVVRRVTTNFATPKQEFSSRQSGLGFAGSSPAFVFWWTVVWRSVLRGVKNEYSGRQHAASFGLGPWTGALVTGQTPFIAIPIGPIDSCVNFAYFASVVRSSPSRSFSVRIFPHHGYANWVEWRPGPGRVTPRTAGSRLTQDVATTCSEDATTCSKGSLVSPMGQAIGDNRRHRFCPDFRRKPIA